MTSWIGQPFFLTLHIPIRCQGLLFRAEISRGSQKPRAHLFLSFILQHPGAKACSWMRGMGITFIYPAFRLERLINQFEGRNRACFSDVILRFQLIKLNHFIEQSVSRQRTRAKVRTAKLCARKSILQSNPEFFVLILKCKSGTFVVLWSRQSIYWFF